MSTPDEAHKVQRRAMARDYYRRNKDRFKERRRQRRAGATRARQANPALSVLATYRKELTAEEQARRLLPALAQLLASAKTVQSLVNMRPEANAPRTLDLVAEHIRGAFAHLGLLKD